MIIEILLLLIVMLALWYLATMPSPDYPPMPPIRLPLIGHMLYLLQDPSDASAVINNLYDRFNKGGVMAWHFGPFKSVFIGDYDIVSDVFKREETNSRIAKPEHNKLIKLFRGNPTGTEGIIYNEGIKWKEQRRFMLTTLRDFGFGKSSMEDTINEEAKYFVEYMKSEKSKENILSVQNLFNIPIINVLWQIVAGSRYEYSDPKFKEIITMVAELMSSISPKPSIAFVFPFLRDLFPSIDPIKEQTRKFSEVSGFLKSIINEHKKNFDSENINDFIDAYLAEIKKTKDDSSSFHESEAYEQLTHTLIDLFFAGSETTSSTLAFAILFMIREPVVQEKVRQEIDNVIGHDRSAKLTDREYMPFTEVTIMEIQRMGNIAPRGLLHSSYLGPVKIGPYTVPKGHGILAIFKSLLQGKEHWDRPDQFDPTRFLDENGKVSRDMHLIPFSIGKRVCPGETLARAEIFLFLVAILQVFKLEPEDPLNPPTLARKSGITSVPLPFGFKLITRTVRPFK